jgi:CHAD domain-containing protein
MAFELNDRKHIGRQLRKIARRQLRRTILALDAEDGGTFSRTVHESRTRVKKVRAVTAFLKAAGVRVPRKDRSRLKSAARTLSHVRDSAAIIEALDRLHHRYSKQLPQHTYEILRRGLVDARDRTEARAHREGCVHVVARRLKKTRDAAENWSGPSIDWPAAIELLTASYRRSRKAMEHARSTGQSAAVHRWRKEVKALWYQLRLAGSLTTRVPALVNDMKRLETALGDDHNLVVLAATLRACPGLRTMSAQIRQVDRLSARMRKPLRRRAFALGRRLHRRKPREFARWLRESPKKPRSQHAAAA